jgi:hypothetical protein
VGAIREQSTGYDTVQSALQGHDVQEYNGPDIISEERELIIKQDFLPKGHLSRSGRPLSNPTSVTLHWIGPFPRQRVQDPRNWHLRGSDGNGVAASYHYIVKDNDVLQCIPDGEVAWHAGGAGNFSSIGIGIIPMNTTGQFSDDTIETLKKLLARFPNLPLKRHWDWRDDRDCPRYYTPVTSMAGVEGRINNPEGGQQRWEELVEWLRDHS